MFTMDQVHTIRELYYNQGLSMAEVAEKVGCNWKTVRKYIDQEDFSPPKPVPESEVVHESKLDTFKPITTALILEILGVDCQTIMEDYLKTNLVNMPKAVRIHDRLMATHGKAFADSAYQAYIADERYLQAAWDAMGENYITEKLGIDEETINRFKAAVLE